MRLVTYDRRGTRRLAAWVGDVVVDLPDAVGHPAFPGTLESLLARNGGTTLDAARAALAYPDTLTEFAVPGARLVAPVAPISLAEDRPIRVLEPDEPVAPPPRGAELECHPQLAAIIGRAGEMLDEGDAAAVIFGYTLLNEWRVRRPDGTVVPAGTSVGPCIVTGDAFDPSGRRAVVSIDGSVVRRTRLAPRLLERFARTISRASSRGSVRPGEMFGLPPFAEPIPVWRARSRKGRPRGLDVAVEVGGIGRLENRVGRG